MDAEFVQDGYIRVYQDIRGLHHSEGEFIMTRPIVGPLNATGIDESTDAYDTIDWMVKNTPETNGRGRRGGIVLSRLHHPDGGNQSAPGDQGRGSAEPHGVDTWRGDDDFHNGAFRNPTLGYIVGQSKPRRRATRG